MDSPSERRSSHDEWTIGLNVKIKTQSGEEFEGEIFSYDSNSNCLILCHRKSHSTLKQDYRMIKTSLIEELQYIGRNEVDPFPEVLSSISYPRIKQREEQLIRTLREDAARIGVNVTKEAQEIFNALHKTLPCRWNKTTIVVFDEITISSPYTIENCTGGTAVSLQRVKKVLEGERKRLNLP